MGRPIFELYNSDGTLQLNLASRLTKYLGSVQTSAQASGSISNGYLGSGTPWHSVSMESDNYSTGGIPPNVSFSGTTMSWVPDAQASANSPCTIIYGIYSNGAN